MGEQHGRDDSADIEENLRREQDASEMNAEAHLLRVEAAEHPTGELRCEDFGDDRPGDEHGGHDGDDDGESFLRVLLAFFGEKSRIDGDECDGGGAAGDDVVEPVGQGESGDVGVGHLSGAESVGDVGLADVSDDAREGDGRHQQQRRGEGGVLVRGTEEAEKTHRLQSNASDGVVRELSAVRNRERQLGFGNQGWEIFSVSVIACLRQLRLICSRRFRVGPPRPSHSDIYWSSS